jgi:hypothetical protein
MNTKYLTYAGADLIATTIAGQTTVVIDTLLVRYAQNKADAHAAGTNFGYTQDIKKVTIDDFLDTTGTAGGAVIDLASTDFPLETTSENYTNNKLIYRFSFAPGELGVELTPNNSEVYFVGLWDETNTTLFSVLEMSEDNLFTLSNSQQIDLAYDFSIIA